MGEPAGSPIRFLISILKDTTMLVIGLDVGTTGTKAVVVDKSGNTLGSGYR